MLGFLIHFAISLKMYSLFPNQTLEISVSSLLREWLKYTCPLFRLKVVQVIGKRCRPVNTGWYLAIPTRVPVRNGKFVTDVPCAIDHNNHTQCVVFVCCKTDSVISDCFNSRLYCWRKSFANIRSGSLLN